MARSRAPGSCALPAMWIGLALVAGACSSPDRGEVGQPCFTGSDPCGGGLECVEGQCVEPECRKDEDCPGQKTCDAPEACKYADSCAETGQAAKTCQVPTCVLSTFTCTRKEVADSDPCTRSTTGQACPAGECRGGKCASPCGNGRMDPGEACEADTDCEASGTKEYCSETCQCRPMCPGGLTCGWVTYSSGHRQQFCLTAEGQAPADAPPCTAQTDCTAYGNSLCKTLSDGSKACLAYCGGCGGGDPCAQFSGIVYMCRSDLDRNKAGKGTKCDPSVLGCGDNEWCWPFGGENQCTRVCRK